MVPMTTKITAQIAQPIVVSAMNGIRGTRCAPAGSETNERASGIRRATNTARSACSSSSRSERPSAKRAPGIRETSPVAPIA
jgi:hypothetical protein